MKKNINNKTIKTLMEPHLLYDQHIDNLLIHIEQTQMRTTWQWTY